MPGYQETRSLLQGPSNSMHSQMAGTHLRKCHRWDELAVVYDLRGGYMDLLLQSWHECQR